MVDHKNKSRKVVLLEFMSTTETLDYIKNSIGVHSLKSISNHTGLSPGALNKTLYQTFGTSNTKNFTGYLTAGELARTISVDRNTVVNWIKRHQLPFFKKITRYEKEFTFINTDDFWEWAALNKDKIDFSKIPPHSIPVEPNWVKDERKIRKVTRNYKGWTTQEEKKLLELAQSGRTFKELENEFARNAQALEKKYYRLLARIKK